MKDYTLRKCMREMREIKKIALCAIAARERTAKQLFPLRELRIVARNAFCAIGDSKGVSYGTKNEDNQVLVFSQRFKSFFPSLRGFLTLYILTVLQTAELIFHMPH